jgi:hypothetical protein
MSPAFGAVLVLAGARGEGKTSACREAAALAAEAGLSVGGIVCPSRRDGSGRPLEIEAESLRSGERRLLASRDGGLQPFSFSEGCFAWALALLRAEAASDLLVLDEIGPLELVLGGGFSPFLDELGPAPDAPRADASEGGLVLLSVRPDLARELEERIAVRLGGDAGAGLRRLELDAGSRSSLPSEIVREALRLKSGKNAQGL